MKLYKLTDENGQTHNKTQWGEGVTHEGTGEGELCGPGWIHAYTHPLLAVFLNPIHANFKNFQLWEAEGEIDKTDNGLKIGSRKLTTLKIIKLPVVGTTNRVAFGLLCAKEVDKHKSWNHWADDWLSGKNRSAANAAAYTHATYATTYAANAATYAANAAATTHATYAAAYAANAAAAAAYAANANADIDLIKISLAAMEVK